MLREVGNHGFFVIAPRAIKQNRNLSQISSDNKDMLFHCPEQGCCSEFTSSEELQDHVHLGKHSEIEASESLYESLRRDWAMKFSSLTLESKIATLEVTGKVKCEVCKIGWALQKTQGSGTRFTEKVKGYLSSRFQTGERTGRKANPAQVAAEMRKAREADGARNSSEVSG